MTETAASDDLIRIVLADANVLYSGLSQQMLATHRAAVMSLNGATDESTVGALRRAGASRTAALVARLLGVE